MSLRDELRAAINRASAENSSNTPDFILAEYLTTCLAAFDLAANRRDDWYGVKLDPSGRKTAPVSQPVPGGLMEALKKALPIAPSRPVPDVAPVIDRSPCDWCNGSRTDHERVCPKTPAQPAPSLELSPPRPLPWPSPDLSREDLMHARERVSPSPRLPDDVAQPAPVVQDIRDLESEHAEMLGLLREAQYDVQYRLGEKIARLVNSIDARHPTPAEKGTDHGR